MRTLPRSAQLFVAVIVLLGCALLVRVLRSTTALDRWALTAAFAVASIVLAGFKLRLPIAKNRSTMSVSFAVDFASLLILGLHPAVLVATAGAWSQSTFRTRSPNPLYRKLFNIAVLGLTIQASGLAYRAFGGTFGHVVWPDAATPLLAATVAYFVVNTLMVATVVALSTNQRVVEVWLRDFTWSAPSYFLGSIAAALIGVVVERSAYVLLPLASVPVYFSYRAYQAYATRLEDETRHREIIESLNEGMFVVRFDGCVDLWNDAIERITGIPRQRVLGRDLFDAVPAFLDASIAPALRETLGGGPPVVLHHIKFLTAEAGRILYVRLLPFAAGVTGFVGDITDRTAAEEALRRSEERHALALAGANDGIWDWDLATDVMYLSLRWKSILGFSPDDLSTRSDEWFGRVHPDDIGPLKFAIQEHCARHSGHFEHEHRILHRDGSYKWVLCRGVAVINTAGLAVRMAGSLTDVTERHAIQEQLRQAALHDTLTGLPNRALFMELLEQALAHSQRSDKPLFATLFIDVDRFKVINDSLGHVVGDRLLVEITRRLHTCLRQGEVIARLGGDEFTLLLNDLSDRSEAIRVASRIQALFDAPFVLDGQDVFVTASIGVAFSSTGYSKAEDVLRDADTAMYRAKALGRNRQEIFDVSMHSGGTDRLNLEAEIRSAVERGEFHLCYQPIVSLSSEQLVAFEALLRWTRRDGRIVTPSEFIPLAEEIGMIDMVGVWTIREACRQLREWQERRPEAAGIGMMVNISSRQLTHPTFVEDVVAAVRDAGIDPDRLRLEITETGLMKSPDAATEVLNRLHDRGVQVYLDDFGTGYSSLSYLHRFPVSTLKIDRSFVSNLEETRERPVIVESILALARSVGVDVIAEGVETRDQMLRLRHMGCEYAQGFFISHPLPPLGAEAFMSSAGTPWSNRPAMVETIPQTANIH